MFINEIDFHRLFDGMLKFVFSFFSQGISADVPANNVWCTCMSIYVIQPRDLSPDHPRCAEWEYSNIHENRYFKKHCLYAVYKKIDW